MKLTLKLALECAWVLVNVFALVATICYRVSMHQIWDTPPLTHSQVEVLANTASRDRVNSLFLECNQVLRDGVGILKTMETIWALTPTLNIAIVVAYYIHARPKYR
jgi:hypothetical protein